LIVAAGSVALIAISTAASTVPAALVESAAISALSNQYTSVQGVDDTAVNSLFTGAALTHELALRDHVRSLDAAASDYPGVLDLTNIKVLAISGTSTTASIDFSAHGKLSNMRNGTVTDYSQSDVIYHVTLLLDTGRWKVATVDMAFAPGGGP
jgi:hypothetical protein